MKSWSLSQEASFAADREYCRKPELVKIQRTTMCAHTQLIHPNIAPTLEAQGTSWERERKDCKNLKIKEFVMRLCLLTMPRAIPIKSP